MRVFATIILLILSIFLSGCVCKRLIKAGAGGASGRVIDEKTREPIAGASVTRQGAAKAIVLTDAEGRFTIKPLVGLRCWPIFPPVFVGPYYLISCFEFAAPGYKPLVITNWSRTFDFEPTNLPPIELQHQTSGGALDEAQVVAIARAAVATNDTWLDRAEFETPKRQPDGSWNVLVWRLPKVPGGHRLILIDENGRVTDYIRGR